jgi:hypothetical protein
MEQKDFLKQYKDQVEFIGKDGIVGIMKSARFEINKKNKTNKNQEILKTSPSYNQKRNVYENNRYERQKSENIISLNRNEKVNNKNKLKKNNSFNTFRSSNLIKGKF